MQTKANKKLNLVKKLKFEFYRKLLETIFIFFIKPTLEYADCIWAGTYEINLGKLDKVQIDAMWIDNEQWHVQISTICIKRIVGQV